MCHTRRSVLAAATMVGPLLAGCSFGGQETPGPEYKIYVRNETHEPYRVTVEALTDDDGVVFSSGEADLLSTQDAELYGPFPGPFATIRVEAESLHDGVEAKTYAEAYRPPEDDCTNVVTNRIFLTPDGSEYDTLCSDR